MVNFFMAGMNRAVRGALIHVPLSTRKQILPGNQLSFAARPLSSLDLRRRAAEPHQEKPDPNRNVAEARSSSCLPWVCCATSRDDLGARKIDAASAESVTCAQSVCPPLLEAHAQIGICCANRSTS